MSDRTNAQVQGHNWGPSRGEPGVVPLLHPLRKSPWGEFVRNAPPRLRSSAFLEFPYRRTIIGTFLKLIAVAVCLQSAHAARWNLRYLEVGKFDFVRKINDWLMCEHRQCDLTSTIHSFIYNPRGSCAKRLLTFHADVNSVTPIYGDEAYDYISIDYTCMKSISGL